MNQHLSVIPRLSEKTYAQSASGVYVFTVSPRANKQQIADAVASQFGVTVTDVRTTILKGKKVRSIRSGKAVTGRRSNLKKAYVSLKEGDKLPIFDAVE